MVKGKVRNPAGGPPHTLFKPGNKAALGRKNAPHLKLGLMKLLESSECDGLVIPPGKTAMDMVLSGLVRAAANGDPGCQRLLWDRIDGKMAEKVEVTGGSGGFNFSDLSDAELVTLERIVVKLGGSRSGDAEPSHLDREVQAQLVSVHPRGVADDRAGD